MALPKGTKTIPSSTPGVDPEIEFYDIASGPPLRPYAPNPWKTRYALNFKQTPYTTHFIPLPSVPSLRSSFNLPAVRKHIAIGEDFPTLPIIQDIDTGDVVGDSFDIAVYLDKKYPSTSGEGEGEGGGGRKRLIKEGKEEEVKEWNKEVDRVFTIGAYLSGAGMPFDPETAEESKKEFCRRAGREGGSWEELLPSTEARVQILENFRKELEGLAGAFVRQKEEKEEGGGEEEGEAGPFLEGKEASYKDLIVGGWLEFMKITLREDEWRKVSEEWCGGVWGRLWEGLQRWAQGKPGVGVGVE